MDGELQQCDAYVDVLKEYNAAANNGKGLQSGSPFEEEHLKHMNSIGRRLDIAESKFYDNIINDKYNADVNKFMKSKNVIIPDLLLQSGTDNMSRDDIVQKTNLTTEHGLVLDAADGELDGVVHKDVFGNFFSKYNYIIDSDGFRHGMMELSKDVLLENLKSDKPIQALTDIYNSFDTNGDGIVSTEELNAGIEKLSQLQPQENVTIDNSSANTGLPSAGQTPQV